MTLHRPTLRRTSAGAFLALLALLAGCASTGPARDARDAGAACRPPAVADAVDSRAVDSRAVASGSVTSLCRVGGSLTLCRAAAGAPGEAAPVVVPARSACLKDRKDLLARQ